MTAQSWGLARTERALYPVWFPFSIYGDAEG